MSGMATDSDLGKPVIAKLNSLNYQLWKLKMKVLLMRDGLWDLVSQPKPCPISEDWSLKECKAIAAMSHGRRRPSYPFCATANCPGNVTNAIATRALGYAKILMYKATEKQIPGAAVCLENAAVYNTFRTAASNLEACNI
ncbi:hypothetical protein T08_3877 [Trichinella sp. T8]|nr:hypothetical protein T08_3877 [Trichinella sp. T8]